MAFELCHVKHVPCLLFKIKYIDIKEKNYSLGIIGTVENNKLSIVVRNLNFDIVDSVEITKKNR